MENQMKFVDFNAYCGKNITSPWKCKYRDRDENQKPCCYCLEVSARENSQIPEYWEDASK